MRVVINIGKQIMPPQNIPLWPKDYFELKANEKEQTQDELSAVPASTWKWIINSPCRGIPSTPLSVPYSNQR